MRRSRWATCATICHRRAPQCCCWCAASSFRPRSASCRSFPTATQAEAPHVGGKSMVLVRYTVEHEWVRLEGDVATVGITDYAQQSLGDIVFVELPEPGREVQEGVPCAVVESVKAA